MAHSPCIDLSTTESDRLLRIARSSIVAGLVTRRAMEITATELRGKLAEPHGNFVTLSADGALRGCVGTIIAAEPLAQGVAVSAFNAAFRDSRFPPLYAGELDAVRISISVLSQPVPLPARSLDELLTKVQRGEHGLIVEERAHRATLLPKVWGQLPDAREFVTHLLLKAGLPGDYWSDSIRFRSYSAVEFAE